MRFDEAWSQLQARLRPGLEIPNWTRDGGYIGGDFRLAARDPRSAVVDAPDARGLQTVGRGEFEKVFDLWPGYVAGTVPRRDLRDATRFSKYVISLLRWLEGELGQSLSDWSTPGVPPSLAGCLFMRETSGDLAPMYRPAGSHDLVRSWSRDTGNFQPWNPHGLRNRRSGETLDLIVFPAHALLIVEERLREQEAEGIRTPTGNDTQSLALRILILAELIPRGGRSLG